MLSKEKLLKKLREINQQHLLSQWDKLNSKEREALAKEIDKLDSDFFLIQQKLLKERKAPIPKKISPFTQYDLFQEDDQLKQIGEKLIGEGKVGSLIVAGGQGSRLGWKGPKGTYPLLEDKTLFHIFAEKTKGPLAIMTSMDNHQETVAHFEKHGFFGLNPNKVFFFSQQDYPFLDDQGNLILLPSLKIAKGPGGNGQAPKAFNRFQIAKKWQEMGVEYVTFIQVDNPLADPFDPYLIGYHTKYQQQVTVKCIERKDPEEKVGILINQGQVIEYSECPKEEFCKTDNQGLVHKCACISLFCFDLSFLISLKEVDLPWHLAKKKVPFIEKKAWKFEQFIFDILPFAKHVRSLLYPRERCFAPLKNKEGRDSPQEVKKAYLNSLKVKYG